MFPNPFHILRRVLEGAQPGIVADQVELEWERACERIEVAAAVGGQEPMVPRSLVETAVRQATQVATDREALRVELREYRDRSAADFAEMRRLAAELGAKSNRIRELERQRETVFAAGGFNPEPLLEQAFAPLSAHVARPGHPGSGADLALAMRLTNGRLRRRIEQLDREKQALGEQLRGARADQYTAAQDPPTGLIPVTPASTWNGSATRAGGIVVGPGAIGGGRPAVGALPEAAHAPVAGGSGPDE